MAAAIPVVKAVGSWVAANSGAVAAGTSLASAGIQAKQGRDARKDAEAARKKGRALDPNNPAARANRMREMERQAQGNDGRLKTFLSDKSGNLG